MPSTIAAKQMFVTTTIAVIYFTVFIQVCRLQLCCARAGRGGGGNAAMPYPTIPTRPA